MGEKERERRDRVSYDDQVIGCQCMDGLRDGCLVSRCQRDRHSSLAAANGT